ncbi:hypothetical protein ACQ858_13705 [Variovorax ureilyticus]|uniref:hypothetical protein n=1 Tax=Variovorax ureilyticus TaxID=1836198 RepID=UPI003D675725
MDESEAVYEPSQAVRIAAQHADTFPFDALVILSPEQIFDNPPAGTGAVWKPCLVH